MENEVITIDGRKFDLNFLPVDGKGATPYLGVMKDGIYQDEFISFIALDNEKRARLGIRETEMFLFFYRDKDPRNCCEATQRFLANLEENLDEIKEKGYRRPYRKEMWMWGEKLDGKLPKWEYEPIGGFLPSVEKKEVRVTRKARRGVGSY